jgi:hypothetical protein
MQLESDVGVMSGVDENEQTRDSAGAPNGTKIFDFSTQLPGDVYQLSKLQEDGGDFDEDQLRNQFNMHNNANALKMTKA